MAGRLLRLHRWPVGLILEMIEMLSTLERDLRAAVDAMQEKAWREAQRPTAATQDILYPGWRDDLQREVEKYRAAGVLKFNVGLVLETTDDDTGKAV